MKFYGFCLLLLGFHSWYKSVDANGNINDYVKDTNNGERPWLKINDKKTAQKFIGAREAYKANSLPFGAARFWKKKTAERPFLGRFLKRHRSVDETVKYPYSFWGARDATEKYPHSFWGARDATGKYPYSFWGARDATNKFPHSFWGAREVSRLPFSANSGFWGARENRPWVQRLKRQNHPWVQRLRRRNEKKVGGKHEDAELKAEKKEADTTKNNNDWKEVVEDLLNKKDTIPYYDLKRSQADKHSVQEKSAELVKKSEEERRR